MHQFKNVEILLRMYLTILISNSSSERAMSKLKLIKDRLCTSMVEDTLNERTILNSEYDILDEIDLSEVMDQFVDAKARKVPC